MMRPPLDIPEPAIMTFGAGISLMLFDDQAQFLPDEAYQLNIEVYPQCVIIPGDLHFIEEEMLSCFKI